MVDYGNFIQDLNRFKLASPPESWLRQLFEFDPSLVVIPSRQSFCYRLTQRRKTGLTEKLIAESLKEQADTAMMLSHGLVPVTTIVATANWSNPLMWKELAERAPWRQGGADAVLKRIEAAEQAEEIQKQLAVEDIKTQTAKDSWSLYKRKTGVGRNFHGIAAPQPKHS